MRIGLIANPYSENTPSGLGTSIRELVKHFLLNKEHSFKLFVKGEKLGEIKKEGENWEMITLKSSLFWLDFGLPKYKDVDVFVFFTPFFPFFFTPKQSLVIVRDFGCVQVPANGLFDFLKKRIIFFIHKRSIKRAKRVVAISEGIKKEILQYCHISPGEIDVVYNGLAPLARLEKESVDAVTKPFFLSVGVVKKRKNVKRVVEAFISLDDKNKQLVIVGSYGGAYYEEIRHYIEEKKFTDNILFLGYVSDRQLAFLYSNAEALVFPSLVEGFGKPIIEAMSFGTPVITSNTPVLKEVSGGAAICVNPLSVLEIREALSLVQDPSTRQDLSLRGKKRSKDFSWEKTAKDLFVVIKDMLR